MDQGAWSFIDLRGHQEFAALPSVLASSTGVRYIHHPLATLHTSPGNPGVSTIQELNHVFLDDCQGTLAELLTLMAAPAVLPAIVSCYVGKGRTGLVSALLLELAGVDRQTVVEDYALTGRYATQLMPAVYEAAVRSGVDRETFRKLMECRANAMETTLDYLDTRYGDAEHYAVHIGVPAATVRDLRDALVGPAG